MNIWQLADIKHTSIGPVGYPPKWEQPHRQPEWAGTPAHCGKQWPDSITWLLTVGHSAKALWWMPRHHLGCLSLLFMGRMSRSRNQLEVYGVACVRVVRYFRIWKDWWAIIGHQSSSQAVFLASGLPHSSYMVRASKRFCNYILWQHNSKIWHALTRFN